MKIFGWIVVGWLGIVLMTALGSRLAPGHVIPEVAVIVAVYLALHRPPIVALLVAGALGYFVGRQAGAPVGLHETALCITTLFVYLMSGRLVAEGASFFALISSGGVMVFHSLLALLVWATHAYVGFASTAAALLIPAAFLTGIMAMILYPLLAALDVRLAPKTKEILGWS